MIETLMTAKEMWDLYDATAANHELLMATATDEQKRILEDNLSAMRLAVAGCAELMHRVNAERGEHVIRQSLGSVDDPGVYRCSCGAAFGTGFEASAHQAIAIRG